MASTEPGTARHARLPRDIAYYNDRPPLKDSARRLLGEYSKIPEDEIDAHVERIRQEAFQIFPYPCIGMARFLDMSILSQSIYAQVLERIKQGDKLLDLGCCFGQEIRQLVLDGAPAENLVGSDLRPEFFDMGYELFRDKSTLGTRFVAADVFDGNTPLLRDYAKQFNIIYTGSFFHLFSYDEQVKVAHLVNELLVPAAGALLIGRQIGRNVPGVDQRHDNQGMAPYRHNAASWKEFWQEFGQRTGTSWDVQVVVDDSWRGFAGQVKTGEDEDLFSGITRMSFVIRRL